MNKYEMKQKAYQSALKSRALQVLIYLIDRSNKEGTCFPAIATMSRELHISVSTVKRALRELTESGIVKKESRFREKNQGQTSNLYILCFLKENEEGETKKEEDKYVDKNSKDNIVLLQVGQITRTRKFEIQIVNEFVSSHLRFYNWPYCYINTIFGTICVFLHVLQWPGEGVNFIPP